MQLKVGQTLVSTVDVTTVVVVRAPGDDVTVTCGGAPMAEAKADPVGPRAADPAQQDGTLIGKRYMTADGSLELLCTKAGQGTLGANGAALSLKDAKPLPSSD